MFLMKTYYSAAILSPPASVIVEMINATIEINRTRVEAEMNEHPCDDYYRQITTLDFREISGCFGTCKTCVFIILCA